MRNNNHVALVIPVCYKNNEDLKEIFESELADPNKVNKILW